MSWKPLGKFVLVRLHMTGSIIEIQGEGQYNGLGDVIAVGPDVQGVVDGDIVLLNGPAGLIAHKELGEHVALVAAPLLLAVRKDEVRH